MYLRTFSNGKAKFSLDNVQNASNFHKGNKLQFKFLRAYIPCNFTAKSGIVRNIPAFVRENEIMHNSL